MRPHLLRSPLAIRLLLLTGGLLVMGLLSLYSASAVIGAQRHGDEGYFLLRQAIASVFGIALALGLAQLDYRTLQKYAPHALVAVIILLAATYVPGLGWHAQGAQRWLRLGPLSFQPSELAKVALSLYLSAFLVRRREVEMGWEEWTFRLAPVGVLLLLVFRQPDLGSTILLCVVMTALFFLAGVRLTYLGIISAVGAVVAFLAMWHSDYRRRRLLAFLNPWSDPQGAGFQTIQSFLSFHSGRLFGTGLGNGNSKLFFLPEVHTDFVFAHLGEEMGFLGAIFVLAGFACFAHLLLRACRESRDAFGAYLAFGLGLSLVLPMIVNLGGVTGLLPVKGLALPFFSWGRSALVANFMSLGLLLSVLRQNAPTEPVKIFK